MNSDFCTSLSSATRRNVLLCHVSNVILAVIFIFIFIFLAENLFSFNCLEVGRD